MRHRNRGLPALCGLLAIAFASIAIAACGSSSSTGNAKTLLRQTFTGAHTVNSGDLSFTLSVNPSGSSTLSGPITLSFGGPFQSLGKGKLPESDFNVSISALGKTGTLGIVSTGTNGYVTLSGTSYQLPAATFQKLESSFASIASSSGASGSSAGSSTLSKLGIDPLQWLVKPSVVGNETVSGANTTHIHAGVDVAALLGDVSTFLGKAQSLGVSATSKLPTTISPTTRQRIASEVQNPSFDVWTGTGDKTIRKLSINLTVPVSGEISSVLGGLRSAAIGLTIAYSNLNKPQTITAPANVQPYSQFQAKIKSLLGALEAAGGSAIGTGTGTSSPGTTGTTSTTSTPSSGSGSNVSAYTQCISAANGDVTKMQKCAPLLNGSGG
jgi:hypothetical protein